MSTAGELGGPVLSSRANRGGIEGRGRGGRGEGEDKKFFAQFVTEVGEITGPQIEIPYDLTGRQLNGVINELLSKDKFEPYSFYINDQVTSS